MKRVPRKGIYSNIKNVWIVELRNRHAVLMNEEEDENDECKKRVRTRIQGQKSACEESSKFIYKMKIECDYKKMQEKK